MATSERDTPFDDETINSTAVSDFGPGPLPHIPRRWDWFPCLGDSSRWALEKTRDNGEDDGKRIGVTFPWLAKLPRNTRGSRERERYSGNMATQPRTPRMRLQLGTKTETYKQKTTNMMGRGSKQGIEITKH